DPDFAESLGFFLNSQGYKTHLVCSEEDALGAVKKFDPQVALLDNGLCPHPDVQLISELHKNRPQILYVMVTDFWDGDIAVRARKLGAYDYVKKPIQAPELLAALNRCFEKIRLENEKAVAEKALLEESRRKKHVSRGQSPSIGIAHRSLEGTWTLFNQQFCEIVGYTREELLGKSVSDIVHPEDQEENQLYVKRLLAGEIDSFTREKRYVRKDGSIVWVNVIVSLITDPAGQPESLVYVIEDISKYKGLEEDIEESEDRFQHIFDHSNDMIFIVDPHQDQILDVNPKACSVLGYTRRELLSLRLSDIHPQDLDKLKKFADSVLEKKGDVTDQLFCRTKTGSFLPTEVSASFISISGKPYMVALARDITERKTADEEVVSLSKFPAENPHPILRVKEDGTVLYANLAAFSILSDWNLKRYPVIPPPFQHLLEKTFLSNAHQEFEVELKNQRFLFEFMPVADADYVNIYGHNITERKRAVEADQKASLNLINALSRVQSQYITCTHPHVMFNELLENLLSLTQSKYGFVGEVSYVSENKPYLKINALSNLAWDEESKKLYAELEAHGIEFYNMKTLFGAVVTTGKTVISNNPSTDSRSGGLPKGHPVLESFMGVPLRFGDSILGMIGMANRPGGYDESLVEYLQSLLNTCGHILEAYRKEKRLKEAEEALCDAHNLTSREKEILLHVASGAANQEIADQLYISLHTVKTHIYNIFRKIGVDGRLQAALWAAKNL
ncbi:MAG: PAS domain S-box protein, partial [Nitrospinales bacterium]